MFNTKKMRVHRDTNEDCGEEEKEEETRWEKAWTQEEWDAKIKQREDEIMWEEKSRQERITKQKRLERSWDLLKLCKEMMREEGYNWKVSKEKGDEERRKQEEREERLRRAEHQKGELLEKLDVKKKQQKITEALEKIPDNRMIMLERELERERRINLKEAKEEVWKRWRLTKGRRKTNPHKNLDKSNLDKKLEKIEKEVERYEEELRKMRDEKQKKDKRLDKKKKLEGHWEMLRWIVAFMGENESRWKEMRMERERDRRKREEEEQWLQKSREERIRELVKREEQEKKEAKSNKEAMYKEAVRLKRSWRQWRGDESEEEDREDAETEALLGENE